MSRPEDNTDPSAGATGRQLRCPRCKKRVAREATPAPPFCSERCRLVDLGDWLDEKHRIAGDPVSSEAAGDRDGD